MKYGIAIVVLLALGGLWWAFSPLLFNTEVQDDLDPELAALLEEMPEPFNTSRPIVVTVSDSGETMLMPLDTTEETEEPAEPVTQPDPAAPKIAGPFSIIDTPGHPASGVIRTITTPTEQLVRFENYDGTNGPDLFVYLAKDLDANEFISLGRARGNMGNINYEVPADVDLSEYQYVMTWCRAFGVLFDYAEIN